MKIFDSHIHIFTEKIIRNVQQKKEMVKRLKLQANGAEKRSNVYQLKEDMGSFDFEGALLLPGSGLQTADGGSMDSVWGGRGMVEYRF